MIVTRRWLYLVCAVLLTFVLSLANFSELHADTDIVVHKGNTLWGLAHQYHTSVKQLKQSNHLTSDMIVVDQTLWIPTATQAKRKVRLSNSVKAKHVSKASVVVVHSGDTLWGIAQQRHTTVQHIMQLNRLSSSLIFPGEKLKVQGAYPIQAAAFRRSTSLVRRSANTVSSSVHTLAYHTGIPEHLIPVYQQAGARYGIPWTVLAAIHRTETNFATGPVVSPAGAEGPMQFMPSTFREYAVSAPGHSGPPDINNVDDAIYTCAHMLAADGYRNNPEAALYLYDHSSAYVYTVQSLARSYAA